MACHQLCVHNQSSKGGISNASIQGNPAASKGDISIFSASMGDVSLGIKTDSSGVSDGANLHGFAVSFADVDSEQLNTQVHFDTDSIFFVCNNSTTGHICNDIQKFIPDTMQQKNKSLTTANGTEPCLQEGTVRIRLIDDASTQHIFILDNCLYHPTSPMKLLSMRCLAEKFLNADGNTDKETCIESWYSTHVLT
jgi:hypothetical protein